MGNPSKLYQVARPTPPWKQIMYDILAHGVLWEWYTVFVCSCVMCQLDLYIPITNGTTCLLWSTPKGQEQGPGHTLSDTKQCAHSFWIQIIHGTINHGCLWEWYTVDPQMPPWLWICTSMDTHLVTPTGVPFVLVYK